ncbi:hypothetical protein ACP4OV_012661 [Aristida adscensionis]
MSTSETPACMRSIGGCALLPRLRRPAPAQGHLRSREDFMAERPELPHQPVVRESA